MTDRTAGKRAKLISFSGIDGAGKSTQIANLCFVLREAGFTVQLITFWDDVARFKWMREGIGHTVFRGDKGVGTPEAPIHRRDKNVRSPLMTFFRMGMYMFDAASLRRISKKALRSEVDLVIFDRYLYDELANLNLRNATTRLYLQVIMKLVPRPIVSFILDADPKQAFARKPEYPLDFLYSNRKSYLTLSRILGGMTVIRPAPILEAKRQVVRHVFCDLLGRSPPVSDAD
jgi:thymidylate kinase